MNKINKSRIVIRILTFTMLLAALLSLPNVFGSVVMAEGQETCPDGGDWVKIEIKEDEVFSYTYTADEGKLVVETCYKAGTEVEYDVLETPQKSVEIKSEFKFALSHISVKLADEPETVKSKLTLQGVCDLSQIGNDNLGTISWTVTNNNDEAIPFTWKANNEQQGSGSAPANGTASFQTSGNGNTVTLSYELNQDSVTTKATVDVCEPKQELKELTLSGECLNNDTIQWTVVNKNDTAINFTWKSASENGSGQVPASGQATFTTSDETTSVTVSYELNEESLSVSGEVEACETKQEFDELTLSGECLNEGTIQWTVVNDNDAMVDFSWESASENGSGQVPALGQTTFTTSDESNSVTVSYDLNEESLSVSSELEACEEKEEEEEEERDPQPEEQRDSQPDEPAGGSGPSIFSLLTPVFFGISGLALASVLLFNKKIGFVKVQNQ